jgi:hypothetical protein
MSTTAANVPTAPKSLDMPVFKSIAGRPSMIGIVIFTILSIGLYIGSFVTMSNFIGSKDDWNIIKPQLTKIWGLTLGGTVALMIASFLYFVQDPTRMIYFILLITCLTLGLSFSALAIAAISR